eukprot:1342066-Amorphochlora_amoeboformis.AAC.2
MPRPAITKETSFHKLNYMLATTSAVAMSIISVTLRAEGDGSHDEKLQLRVVSHAQSEMSVLGENI